ncbi:MAG: OmpA family protein [Bacteroidetes bacterium]|nr:MAG: OmpA family protein [Bacteroidota bacterium]
MKYSMLFSAVITILLLLPQEARSQKVKVNVKEKVVEETDNRANRKTDEIIDAGFDKVEEGIGNLFKKKDKKSARETEIDGEKTDPRNDEPANRGNKNSVSGSESQQLALKWNKYDFVPGEKILFEDNQEGEENGEFPSRWDLAGGGNVENAAFGDQNVIYFKEASSCIVPFFKEPEKDNLPNLFTIEFDCWFEPEEYCQYLVDFWDHKNQSEGVIDIDALIINANHAGIHGLGEGFYPGFEEKGEITSGFWRHVAISFNTRALKVYLDDARVVNIPNLGINPEGLTICCDHMNSAGAQGINRFVRNVRIAEGAVKLYDKLIQDGKIVTNGIRFDVNKATIRPESMGIINEIAKLMKEHPEIIISVEGHTDSDGETTFNQSLSERRAEAVMNELVRLGIDGTRMTSKGFGESAPIDTNNTPEGKANNRRVEFVKI